MSWWKKRGIFCIFVTLRMLLIPIKMHDAFLFAIAEEECALLAALLFGKWWLHSYFHQIKAAQKPMQIPFSANLYGLCWITHINKSQMISTLHSISLCTFFVCFWNPCGASTSNCIQWSTYTCLHCIVHNQSTAMQRGHECAWVWQGIIEARGR